MKTALLLVDVQNDYFPGGAMEVVGAEAAAIRAKALLDYFRSTKQLVVHVQHMAVRPGSTFFLPDTDGADIHASVIPQVGEPVIIKHFPNAFYQTDLLAKLQERSIEQLVIAGMMTHMCIDTTTRAAKDAGFACIVASDACATRDQTFAGKTVPAADVQTAFLAALSYYFANVMSATDIPALLTA